MPITLQSYHSHGQCGVIDAQGDLYLIQFPYTAQNEHACAAEQVEYLESRCNLVTWPMEYADLDAAIAFLADRAAAEDPNFTQEADGKALIARYESLSVAEIAALLSETGPSQAETEDVEMGYIAVWRWLSMPIVQNTQELMDAALNAWERWQARMAANDEEAIVRDATKALLSVAAITESTHLVELVKRPIHHYVDSVGINDMDIFRYAYLMGDLEDHHEAIWAYLKFIGKVPDVEVGYCNLGTEYGDIGNMEKALEYYNKTIEMNPGYISAWYNRAFAYEGNGDFDLAIADLQKTLEIDPEYANAHNLLACIALQQDKPMEALIHAQNAVAYDPADAYCLSTMAEVHSALGNRPLFYQYLKKSLALDANQMNLIDVKVYERHREEQQFQHILLKYPRK